MRRKSEQTTERKSFRVNEIAERHGLSVSFVYKLISQGDLNARKVGEATIVTLEDEAAWLAAMPSMPKAAAAAGPKAAA
jgi:excisionase family DNA binding protein